MTHENQNLAVVEARGIENEKNIDRLFELTEKNTVNVGLLTRAVDSARQANEYAFKMQEKDMNEMKPKVNSLWENRSEAKGGWTALKFIGTVVGTTLTLTLMWMALKH